MKERREEKRKKKKRKTKRKNIGGMEENNEEVYKGQGGLKLHVKKPFGFSCSPSWWLGKHFLQDSDVI